jgi:Family of unknown function (DUF6325)
MLLMLTSVVGIRWIVAPYSARRPRVWPWSNARALPSAEIEASICASLAGEMGSRHPFWMRTACPRATLHARIHDDPGEDQVTDQSLDELGPVDYVVVEFPAGASNFTGEIVTELLALVDSGTIRVIDVLILTKDEDGGVEATELGDIGELGELQALEAQLAELLAEEDVEQLAAAMEPGSTAGVLIWENLWAARFAAAARRSGGQLIANGRIPIQAIIASIEAEQAPTTGGE